MSDPSDKSGRPHQVGMGAWMVIAAGALHVVGSFDDMRGLRSLETKERVDEAIDAMADSGLALARDQLLDVMHVGVLVSAAAATAAVVMGIQALKRDRIAPRVLIGLSLLVVVGSVMFDPLMGMFVAAGTVLLWSGPARDWFAGRPIRASRMELAMNSAGSQPSGQDSAPPARPEPTQPPAQQPPTQQGDQPPAQQPAQQPPAYGQGAPPYGQPPHPYGQTPQAVAGQPPGGVARPGAPATVKVACLVTILLSALTALAAAATMVMLLVMPRDEIRQAVDDALSVDPQLQEAVQGSIDLSDLIAMVGVALGVIVIWAAIATMLAILTWRRHNWARALLITSAVVAAIFSALALPATVLHVVATIGVVVLLVVPATNAWFRGDRASRGPYPGQPGYGQQPPPGPQASPRPPQQQDPRRDEDGQPPVW